MDYLNYIYNTYPIRRTERQKEEFREYIKDTAKKLKQPFQVEKLKDKHNNIILGNLDTAKIIFTAHYDTPATSLFPNIMLPRNPHLSFLYHIGYSLLIAFTAVFIAFIIGTPLKLNLEYILIIYLIIYFIMYYSITRSKPNKNNKNDNTSGVAAALKVLEDNPNAPIAIILFDNEEKGLLGSKAYNEKHKQELENKLIMNFDCVGLGNNFIFISKKSAEENNEYQLIKDNFSESPIFKVHHFPLKGSSSNSDYKSFKNGVGVMACLKHPRFGFYTSKIHTNKDTEAYTENIDYLTTEISKCLSKM